MSDGNSYTPNELRDLLRSTNLTKIKGDETMTSTPSASVSARKAGGPQRSGAGAGGRPERQFGDELASLIGSINQDLSRDYMDQGQGSSSSFMQGHEEYRGSTSRHPTRREHDGDNASMASSQSDVSFSELKNEKSYTYKGVDELDHSVIRYNEDYVLRTKSGKYLTARNSNKDSNSTNPIFLLEPDGQGIGEDLEIINFVNLEYKDDRGPIKYGSLLAIKAPAAKERILGIRDGTKLGFWRNLVGAGEKWLIHKAGPTAHSTIPTMAHGAGLITRHGRGRVEELGSRGKFVRLGEQILVQTAKSENLLSLQPSPTGDTEEICLVFKDRAALSAESFQLEQAGSIPLPHWCKRPYLSGEYLAIPPSVKAASAEVEARLFPGSTLGAVGSRSGSWAERAPPTVKLSSMSAEEQHKVLLRELLLVLAGVEGQYIRVAAGRSNTYGANTNTYGATTYPDQSGEVDDAPPSVHDLSLLIDVDSADRSAASLVTLLLPICVSAIRVKAFVKLHAQYHYGQVSHALSAAIRGITREFDILVAQLEVLHIRGELSLQKMVYLLQPSKGTLRTLERLCSRVKEFTGGQLLDALHLCYQEQGDKHMRRMLLQLLHACAQPFLDMLSQWIYRGELSDQYREFMVLEDTSLTKEALQADFNAHYWESRYRLIEGHIPTLLRSHAMRALSAGKFIHVLRGAADLLIAEGSTAQARRSKADQTETVVGEFNSGGYDDGIGQEKRKVELLPVKTLELSLELTDNALCSEVDAAYHFSSRALLRQLERDHGLASHLSSLRKFFLLENGDFFIQFMDTAEEELSRHVREISVTRTQALLQTAIQTSTLATDAHRDDLTCSFASHNLIQHLHLIQSAGEGGQEAYVGLVGQELRGMEAFTLDYQVEWPVSIVISKRSLTKYQLLSRLLYYCKYVERRVLSAWLDHQNTKRLNGMGLHLGPSYCLRHRMLHFLQNFVYYMTLEVIGPRSHELEEALTQAGDIDEVLALHERFLDTCLKECLLASQDLLKILTKLMTTCLLFADQMNRFTVSEQLSVQIRQVSIYKGGSRQAKEQLLEEQARQIGVETSHESFTRMLAKFAETFDSQLGEFLSTLWASSQQHQLQLLNLCVRLDYNGFYSSHFS